MVLNHMPSWLGAHSKGMPAVRPQPTPTPHNPVQSSVHIYRRLAYTILTHTSRYHVEGSAFCESQLSANSSASRIAPNTQNSHSSGRVREQRGRHGPTGWLAGHGPKAGLLQAHSRDVLGGAQKNNCYRNTWPTNHRFPL
jgi:hypothetical protein